MAAIKANKFKKILAVLLVLCMILMPVFSVFFISRHCYHSCKEKECAVCCQLEGAKKILRNLSAGGAIWMLFLPVIYTYSDFRVSFWNRIQSCSLISLKVRMDH